MAVIYPAPGEEKALAQQLLNMAHHVRDVQASTDTAPGTGNVAFVVPEELYDRYVEALRVADGAVEVAAPPAKRRGRPRKAVPAAVEEVASEESENEIEDESDTENDEDPEE